MVCLEFKWNTRYTKIYKWHKYTNNGFMKFNLVINNLKHIIFSNEVQNLDRINHLNSVYFFHFQKLIIQVNKTFFTHSFGFWYTLCRLSNKHKKI